MCRRDACDLPMETLRGRVGAAGIVVPVPRRVESRPKFETSSNGEEGKEEVREWE